ncbi:YeeE/YedE family integral membrane protein [Venturia nashicola]|uniref:YeeE/YedE family integral membrane protein n=1 Tax=Venturia nashicola TaxID=86259 RepID=A0A4Z1PN53_9PEZI|nr:YeeE/YedE family integral membrane protein [Venturia nashicola]
MFTMVDTAIGALLLHQATTSLLFNNGAILGVSGLLRELVRTRSLAIASFFFGMALSYGAIKSIAPEVLPVYPNVKWDLGTTLFALTTSIMYCGGCTSGHMLCGIPRLSPRSFIATAIFFTTAATTFHILNPSLATSACPSKTPCYETIPSLVLKSRSLCLLLSLNALTIETLPRLYIPTIQTSASSPIARQAIYLLCGYTFGLGLLVSGMASPAKVSAFFAFSLFPLDLTKWDPSLLMVILCGMIPNMARWRWRGCTFFKTPLQGCDWKFVLGAATFGAGWGASGICPGPAILRAMAQPIWGSLWLLGFWLGGLT